jgi:hypothetical protein
MLANASENSMTNRIWIRTLLILCAIAALSSCARTYYTALEKVGIEKRDILIDRVSDTRETQTQAKEQFVTALERFRSVIAFDAGKLDEVYDRVSTDYERSEELAAAVRSRIDSVETVAEDLFDEWRDEIGTYSSAELAQQSRTLLVKTEREYSSLIASMKRAESAMAPVLTLFNDQVMFLRHNLNARAIGELRQELNSIEKATQGLIAEMERSIAEADRFIASMS